MSVHRNIVPAGPGGFDNIVQAGEFLEGIRGGRVAVRQRIKAIGRLYAVVTDVRTGRARLAGIGQNIVTDAGDVWFAQKAAGEAVTNVFGILELGSAGNVPAKGSTRADVTTKIANSQKVHDTGYPKTNDDDTDNPGTVGTDIVTFRTSYTTGEANDGAIDRAIITNATPGASEPVLAYGTLTAFAKTSNDTLKFFWNITLNGV